MKMLLASALVLLGTATALGQEDLRVDTTKLYVTDPAACDALSNQGVDAFSDIDFLTLDFDDGIQGMEFHCTFFDVKGRETTSYLFVDAICSAPGEVYPDTLAVTPFTETQIQVVSSYDSTMSLMGQYEPDSQVAAPGATLYTRCDNLSEIPLD